MSLTATAFRILYFHGFAWNPDSVKNTQNLSVILAALEITRGSTEPSSYNDEFEVIRASI